MRNFIIFHFILGELLERKNWYIIFVFELLLIAHYIFVILCLDFSILISDLTKQGEGLFLRCLGTVGDIGVAAAVLYQHIFLVIPLKIHRFYFILTN